MAHDLPRLSRSEWSVMNACWKLGRATAREVHGLAGARNRWEYRTVKTLLDRVAAKGYLEVEKVEGVRVYQPAVERSRAVRRAVDDFLDNVLEGSVAPVLAHLADARRLDHDEVERLRRLLRETDEKDRGDANEGID